MSCSGCDAQRIYSIQNKNTHREPCALGAVSSHNCNRWAFWQTETERGRGRVGLFSVFWNVSCSVSRRCTKDSHLFVPLCVASRRAENKEKHLQPSEPSCGRDEERRPQGSTTHTCTPWYTHMHTLVLPGTLPLCGNIDIMNFPAPNPNPIISTNSLTLAGPSLKPLI